MKKMPKKVVILIVEGKTDKNALERIFRKICEPDNLIVKVFHGDITTHEWTNPSQIVNAVNAAVQNCISVNHLKNKDIAEIIHLVDTDGTFIPDSSVISGENLKYTDEVIETPEPGKIKQRNLQKFSNIKRLLGKQTIKNHPYTIYYMSVNLDHVLYDLRNLTAIEKENNAFAFADKYYNAQEDAINFLCESSFSMKGDYFDSWNFIQKNGNSLHRYSNIHICIQNKMQLQKDISASGDYLF